MLTPEQAQETLQKYRNANAEKQQLKAIGNLPNALRAPAYAILRRDHDGSKRNFQEETDAYLKFADAVAELRVLPVADRMMIFAIFFPKMARHVEQAWQLSLKLPYQVSYSRKPFRVQDPEVTIWSAFSWLTNLVRDASEYGQEVLWFAQYAAYIHHGWITNGLGILFAAVIDSGEAVSDDLFKLLVASARGEDAIGMMGRHIPRALLTASRVEGWEFVESLLLAAQREEGLRQIILETIDEGHPLAFQRMVQLILAKDLFRFSAVVRAADVWFGLGWDAEDNKVVRKTLSQVLEFMGEAKARREALTIGNGEAVYLALWSIAFVDALAAIDAAAPLLQDEDVDRRFAAVLLLTRLDIYQAREALVPVLRDLDLRVVVQACNAFINRHHLTLPVELNLFEEVEDILTRLPKARTFEPLIWPWMNIEANPGQIATILLNSLDKRSPKRLIPYLYQFDEYGRVAVAKVLAAKGRGDAEVRSALLKLVGDRAAHVREEALALLKKQTIGDDEAAYLEGLLTRKTSDLRRGVLSLLANQKDKVALASADRLLAARAIEQRSAGLELLSELVRQERQKEESNARALAYRAAHPQLTPVESNLLDTLLVSEQSKVSLDDVLGLIDPTERTKPQPPKPLALATDEPKGLGKIVALAMSKISKPKPGIAVMSAAARAGLLSLDRLIHEHRATPIWVPTWREEQEEILLGNVQYRFPMPKPELAIEDEVVHLPLREVWEAWVTERPAELRDGDGLELVRMWLHLQRGWHLDRSRYMRAISKDEDAFRQNKYPYQLWMIVQWLVRIFPVAQTNEFLLDCAEASLAEIHREADISPRKYPIGKVRSETSLHMVALDLARRHRDFVETQWQAEHHARLWRLDRWMDEPVPRKRRYRPPLRDLLEAERVGAATVADIYDQLLGPAVAANYVEEPEEEKEQARYFHRNDDYATGQTIHMLSSQKPHPLLIEFPLLTEVFENCRRRLLEVELTRGEMPTVVTYPALQLRAVIGASWFVRILQALGKANFERGYHYRAESRTTVFSHLLRVSVPAPEDNADAFTALVKEAKLPPQRLVEAALYAPQWAAYIAAVIGWDGFTDAVWWVHAHTKESNWYVVDEVRDGWQAQINERTPLSGDDLMAGAVDVAWFWRVYQTLGAERWEMIYEAAKYSAGGQGHTRAKLFAQAMLGQIEQEALIKRIHDKRHQDTVRALGLLPLPETGMDQEILRRYQVIQEFISGAKKFGSQRQESERAAAQIGLENLARTAGYPDPMRMQWALEAEEVADLRAGALSVAVDDVILTLRLNEVGEAQLEVEKGGKALKSIPARLNKAPEVAALRARKTLIEKQRARMKLSLEQAMCEGDSFERQELATLLTHPILASLLDDLIFVSDGRLGYLAQEGRALQDYKGSLTPLADGATLRIAHPHDLYQAGEWHLWQQECFMAERIQPFKQLFRELYLLTAAEEEEDTISRRYAGHQVQPRQALALLGKRRWVVRPEEGVQRTFHRFGFSVFLTFLEGFYTPAEVEGLTLEGVVFMPAGSWWQRLRLTEIPPLLFSEVMRDLDLVVSVAHRGGVDPESSASSVEMRAALIRETCHLLKLKNVELEGRYAKIEGKLGSYSVHLGSGVVHRQPGGSLCIIPVHAQHRGRIFLPFADDDPKTAEVVSKVLLLARDKEIRDPSILEQLVAKG